MPRKNRFRFWPAGHWWIAGLFGALILGCQKAPPPPTDPDAIKREAEKLEREHERERQNK